MDKIAFLEAPICTGSPTDGSQYAFETLRPRIEERFSTTAHDFVPMSPSDRAGMASPYNLRDLEEVIDISRRLYANAKRVFADGDFPMVIGGDHSVAMGSIAAAAETVGASALSVIWIDGHTDINTEHSSQTGCIHGMPLAQAMGLCTDLLNVGQEKIHLLGENLFIVGARSIDDGEWPILQSQGVHLYTAEQVRADGIHAVMSQVLTQVKTPYIHVSFDVDGMDGEVFPATGYRMPDGMTAYEAHHAFSAALQSGKTVSADLVEYNPLLDPDGSCGERLLSFLAELAHVEINMLPARK